MTPIITLRMSEVIALREAAVEIVNFANSAGYHNREKLYTNQHPVENHHIGLIGECAVAKYLGKPWQPRIGDITSYDVGSIYEVRTTRRPDGNLFTHKWDKDGIYILAQLQDKQRVRLAGWARLEDCNRDENWCDWLPAPAYMTKAINLASMATIPMETTNVL